ncbi:hypothetical protein C2W62_08175 [Candidatus Entotheonella serta]|nr:hypothetical protein C2W62_08175 [Candidatus Entotheonella serta]
MIKRLVREWADVVVESFTPGTMAKWGLDYRVLRQLKPNLIMLSTCMQGQTGPHAHYAGFGNMLASLCGFYHVTGYPDSGPMPVYGAYTDFVACRFVGLALLAAFHYRRRTGEGQYIDLSQYEASLHMLAPVLLDYSANGNLGERQGNRWWAGIIAAPLSGLVRVIILIILANIRAGFICLRVLNLSVVIIPTHYRVIDGLLPRHTVCIGARARIAGARSP